MKSDSLLDRVVVAILWRLALVVAFFVVSWKRLKRLGCVLGHRWDWQEIGPGLEFARRVIHGPPFRCLRCGDPWRHGA